MVVWRPEAEFRTQFPLDGITHEGDFVEFPGRSVTEAIREMLVTLGYEVAEPVHAEEHGWELYIRAGGRRFWLQITRIEEDVCNLVARDMTWKIWHKRPSYAQFLTELDAALRADGRFDMIGWFKDWNDETRSPHPAAPE